MTNEQRFLIYLIDCAVSGKKVYLPDYMIDWTAFAAYAEEQQFEHIIYPLLKNIKPNIDSKVWHHLHQRYGRVVVWDNMQDMALAEIGELFDNEKLMYMPLKGSVLKEYYPLPDLRRSSDIDILVKTEDFDRAAELLKGIGYEKKFHTSIMHEVYTREKVVIELHKQLADEVINEQSVLFTNKVWDNMHISDGFRCVMNPEFMMVYLLVHMRSHLLSLGGGGIKLVLDIRILKNSMEVDDEKLSDFLKESGLNNLNSYVHDLICSWWDGEEIKNEYAATLEEIILNSGAYGDYEIHTNTLMLQGKSNRVKNLAKMLFLSPELMRRKYPVLKKYPALLPFMWIHRIVVSDMSHKKTVLDSSISIPKDKARKLKNLFESI